MAALATASGKPTERIDEYTSFEQIYEEYFAFVWRTVRRLGVRERSLDDAAQDVFIVVHRKLSSFEGRSSMKSWIFGIARRVAKDYRRTVERKGHAERLPDSMIDAGAESPSDAARRAEAIACLREFLVQLDDDKREAFILAELEQMTAVEIADAVGANVNTVYSRVRAARQEFEKAVVRHHARERSRIAPRSKAGQS